MCLAARQKLDFQGFLFVSAPEPSNTFQDLTSSCFSSFHAFFSCFYDSRPVKRYWIRSTQILTKTRLKLKRTIQTVHDKLMYFAVHQISPHLLLFVLKKYLCKRNQRQMNTRVKNYFYLLKSKLALAAIANILVPFKPKSGSKPLSFNLSSVRSIYLGSHAKSHSPPNPTSSL